LKITTAKYYIPSGRCIQALDYAHRNEDGSVGYIPDSLISAFKTKNNRVVYDGGGVRPDAEVEIPNPANITISLYTRNLIFDFATEYRTRYDSIPSPAEFTISDELYNQFIKYLIDKEFDYNSMSTDELDNLVKITQREGYYKIAEKEIMALREKLSADKQKDLQTFRNEISDILREEIVSRYYYQQGRIIAGLNSDPQLEKAVELLKDPSAVSAILRGTYEEGEIKLALEK
jgi:carboxyl-terminal processing protease